MAKKSENKIEQLNKKTCTMQLSKNCREENGYRKLGNFYKPINDMFFKTDTIHICKDCIKEYVYKSDGSIDVNRLKKILMVVDAPFFSKEFESALNGKRETIGRYFTSIYLNHQGKGYEDGEIDEIENIIIEGVKSRNEIIDFWGVGFDDDDYRFLEKELIKWKATHKSDTQAEITLLREICITILDLRKARGNKKATKELRKELQDLMKTASVDPAKANAISSGQSVDKFGVWVKDIEQFKPAEWWEKQEKYKDMDGFIPYIKNYIVRPITNFFTGVKNFFVDGEDLSFKEKDEKDE